MQKRSRPTASSLNLHPLPRIQPVRPFSERMTPFPERRANDNLVMEG